MGVIRTRNRAFHPQGEQRVLDESPSVFAVLRISPEGDQRVLSLINVTEGATRFELLVSELGSKALRWSDLASDRQVSVVDGRLEIELKPYDVVWLTPANS